MAKSWFLAIEAGLQRAIAQDAVRSAVAAARRGGPIALGNGNEQAVAEARASVGTYRDTLRQIELAREQALRALELLLGRYPAAEIAVAEQLSPVPPPAPVGMPSQLLERRPDVDRRRAPRRCGLQPRGRSPRGDASANQSDRRGQYRIERTVVLKDTAIRSGASALT